MLTTCGQVASCKQRNHVDDYKMERREGWWEEVFVKALVERVADHGFIGSPALQIQPLVASASALGPAAIQREAV